MTTIQHPCIPQPHEYEECGVPYEIEAAIDTLLIQRKEAPEALVDVIDGAIVRLLEPWTMKGMIEDLGSLLPLDVGFDVRQTNHPVVLNLKPGFIYSIKCGGGQVVEGTAEKICSVLRLNGYKVQIPLPNGRDIVVSSETGEFLVQPKNDNYVICCDNLSQALTAYEYPEMYRDASI